MSALRGLRTFATAILIAASTCSPAAAQPAAHVTMWSQIGDFIGAGGLWDLDYSPSTSHWFQIHVWNAIDGVPSNLEFVLGTDASDLSNSFMKLAISTDQLRRGIEIGPYPRASGVPPLGHARLYVSFQNRACGTGTYGAFVVQEFRYSDAATLDRLVLGFKQACEGSTKDLYGIFWYDASGQPPRIGDATRAAIVDALRAQSAQR